MTLRHWLRNYILWQLDRPATECIKCKVPGDYPFRIGGQHGFLCQDCAGHIARFVANPSPFFIPERSAHR